MRETTERTDCTTNLNVEHGTGAVVVSERVSTLEDHEAPVTGEGSRVLTGDVSFQGLLIVETLAAVDAVVFGGSVTANGLSLIG